MLKIKDRHQVYFVVGAIGIRVWYDPRLWRFAIDRCHDNKTVYSLGPVTFYTGG